MNLNHMDTPKTRKEFERRFNILFEGIENDRHHICVPAIFESLQKIRKLPNNRIDFLSVNETARLQANMMVQFDDMNMDEVVDE